MLSAFIDQHSPTPTLSKETETLQTLLAKTKPSQSDINTLNEALEGLQSSLNQLDSSIASQTQLNKTELKLVLEGHRLLKKQISLRGEDLLKLFPRHFNTQFQHMLLKSRHKTLRHPKVLKERDTSLVLEHR